MTTNSTPQPDSLALGGEQAVPTDAEPAATPQPAQVALRGGNGHGAKEVASDGRRGEEARRSEQTTAFAQALEAHRGERHIIVLQDFPDPDAISAGLAHRLISAEYSIETDIVYNGRISHRQNIALVNLLGIPLTRYSESLDLSHYDGAIFVDNQGTSAETIVAALEAAQVPSLMVIDHHQPQDRLTPEFADMRRVGAAATIYATYLEEGLVELQRSEKAHIMTATALMHGIITDTNGFTRAGDEDFRAAAFLARYRDADLLEQIMTQARSKQTMDIIRQALGNRVVAESYSIAGIGYLRAEDRDAIPQAADFLLTEENVHTAIVYGIMTGDNRREALIGSMRTSRITIDPDDFIKEVLGTNAIGDYFGGGKPTAGGFVIPLGFLSGGQQQDFLDAKWQVYDAQIKEKIFTKIGIETAGGPGR